MSERGESILKGLQDIVDFQNGDKTKCRIRVVTVPDIEPLEEFSKEKIREIRFKNDFTQEHFAELMGVTKKSVEAWEAGTRKPTGTAKRLFQLIEKDPNIINSMVRR